MRTKNMSQEYVLSAALVLASVLKIFGVEIENGVLEGLIAGVAALWIAFRRLQKGDITPLGVRK